MACGVIAKPQLKIPDGWFLTQKPAIRYFDALVA